MTSFLGECMRSILICYTHVILKCILCTFIYPRDDDMDFIVVLNNWTQVMETS